MARRKDSDNADLGARARILEAAITTFASKGFHGTTTRDISVASDTGPSTLYVHHKSKEELLYLICKSGHRKVLELVDQGIRDGSGPTDTLRRVVHNFALAHAEGPAAARVTNYELASLTPEHFSEIREIRHQIEQRILQIVESGIVQGEFTAADPRLVTVALLSLGVDISRWYHEGGRWSPEYISSRYAEVALRIVGADVEA